MPSVYKSKETAENITATMARLTREREAAPVNTGKFLGLSGAGGGAGAGTATAAALGELDGAGAGLDSPGLGVASADKDNGEYPWPVAYGHPLQPHSSS